MVFFIEVGQKGSQSLGFRLESKYSLEVPTIALQPMLLFILVIIKVEI